MAQLAKPPPAELESICFELDRLQVTDDERLELSGRWFGVRGRRFVRPTLTSSADGQPLRALADLEHKPWAAEDGDSWQATFPWAVNGAEVRDLELAVAPDIAVALPAPGSQRPDAERLIASRKRPKPRRASSRPQAAVRKSPKQSGEIDAVTAELEKARGEADQFRGDADQLRIALAESQAALGESQAPLAQAQTALAQAQTATAEAESTKMEAVAALTRTEAELEKLREVADERELARQQLTQAIAERDLARQQFAQAIAERDAVRQQTQPVPQRDAAPTPPARATALPSNSPARRPVGRFTAATVERHWHLRVLALAPLLAATIALAIVLRLI